MRAHSIVAASVLASGCIGRLFVGGPASPEPDAGPPIILFPDDDAGAIDAGSFTPHDAGSIAHDAGPIDACAGVSCGANAHCVDGACRCDEGFIDEGGACTAPLPGDPAARTATEVCDAWRAGHVENAWPPWNAGASECDPGSLPPEAIDDTLRRVNLFRWLVGLPPVSYDGSTLADMMACARMMSANGMLNHMPPTTFQCYTDGGAAAAGRSNLALGVSTSGQAIDLYMEDRLTPSLGHRRWVLSPSLDAVEIGFSGNAQALGVFHFGGTTDRAWTAYPNEGPAPIDVAQAVWSFQANTIGIDATTTVTVEQGETELPVVTSFVNDSGWGPPPTIGWQPSGWAPTAGQTYRVTIHGTSAGDVSYDVELVGC